MTTIELLITPNCPKCEEAIQILDQAKLPYTTFDMTDNPKQEHLAEVKMHGDQTPITRIVLNSGVIDSYDLEQLKRWILRLQDHYYQDVMNTRAPFIYPNREV